MLNVLSRPADMAGKVWSRTSRTPVFHYVVFLLLSILLSKAVVMGELYPFGISFLAAVCVIYPRYAKASLLGALVGTSLAVQSWMLVSYLPGMILLFGVLHRRPKVEGSWLLVPGLVLAIHFLGRASGVFFLENELYQWIGAVFESFFAGILTLAAITGLQAYPKVMNRDALSVEERTSLGLIVLGAVIGIGQASWGGIGVQSVASRWLVLWGACLGGPGGGAAAGVAVGLIPSIGGILTTGPIAFYALSGMLGGIFNSFKKPGVIIGFSLANLLLSLFFSEQAAIAQTFKETAIAAAGFLLVRFPVVTDEAVPGSASASEQRDGETEVMWGRLKKMPQVLEELAGILRCDSETAAGNTPMGDKTKTVLWLNIVTAKVCKGCSLNKVCWEHNYHKNSQIVLEACASAGTAGEITEKDLGTELNRRCRRLRELVAALNYQIEIDQLTGEHEKEIGECRFLVSNQLEGMAGVVGQLICDVEQKRPCEESAAGLRSELEEKGIKLYSVKKTDLPDGDREIIITQAPCHDKNWCKSIVAPNISQLLGRTYGVASRSCVDSRESARCKYRLIPGSAMKVRVGQAQLPKEGADISGDVCTYITLPNQRFALVLSDGMGAGREACAESSAAIDLLERMLSAGFSVETAVRTLNTVFYLRPGKESFVTLDVVVVNTVNGLADFIKLGGAPSLIFSHRGLKQVEAFVPPAGILDRVEMQTFRHLVAPGNTIIMMSDGVWEALYNAGGPAGWLEEVLRKMDLDDPQQVADNLLYLAKKASHKAADDMTVQVARIDLEEIA